MAHKGSWFGLPDFGITEAIGSVFNKPTTSQGGSNLIGYSPPPSNDILNNYTFSTQNTPVSMSSINKASGGSGESVLPASTYTPTSTTTGDNSGSSGPSEQDLINGYWNQLDQSYNQIMGGIGEQKGTQEQMANTAYQQNLADLAAQEQEGSATLATQERKAGEQENRTMKDLAENIRSLLKAGGVYLGARGAGDSSAAQMYSYAMAKEGAKGKSDIKAQTRSIMNDIEDRRASLGRMVTQEKTRLKTAFDTSMQNIANWYQQAMTQVQQAKAVDRNSMSQQILSYALEQLNSAKTAFEAKQSALQQWALSNSQNIAELGSNLQGIAGAPIAQQMFQQPANITSSAPTANYFGGAGSTTSSDDYIKKLYGIG